MNLSWERLGQGVFRTRLPFLDVTIGLVQATDATVLIDAGTTLTEARAVAQDVQDITGTAVSHVVLTHHHFDHVLGSSVFTDAAVYSAPEVARAITQDPDGLRADAIAHGADPGEVARALAAVRAPTHQVRDAALDLGDRILAISHPGAGHTDHDLIVVVPAPDRAVVFCGDLVEQSGDPVLGPDSDPGAWPDTLDRVLAHGGRDAAYVPGHGGVVDAEFVRHQQRWLRTQL